MQVSKINNSKIINTRRNTLLEVANQDEAIPFDSQFSEAKESVRALLLVAAAAGWFLLKWRRGEGSPPYNIPGIYGILVLYTWYTWHIL